MIIFPESLTGGTNSDVKLFAKNAMNCGLQYDARHSLFAGLNLENHWLNGIQSAPKQESQDEGEFGSFKKATNASSAFAAPLTPPGLNAAFNAFPTPQSDYPSSSSPQQEFNNNNKVAASGCSSEIGATPSAEMPAAPTTPKSESGKTSPRLTPPGSIPSPTGGDGVDKQVENEGSQSSNSENEFYENGDSLKRLQLALQRPGMMPEEKLQCPMCEFSCHVRSQFNEHLIAHETKCTMCDFNTDAADKLRDHLKKVHDCDEDLWVEDEPGLTLPKVNSQGKVKTFRCKQCDFSAVTKLDFWEHSRVHIKQERLLTCPKCPFVTEYKHHLEYHLRNHVGSKPFKCDKCSYSCVNKSMLNSHLKSHSNVYQFRCNDCTYATKYCHSLKLHLRKYRHNPAMVLNSDGSPNPLPIVDVYGTKRGPKPKNKSEKRAQQAARQQEQQNQQQQLQQTQQQQLPVHIFNPYSLLPTQMPYYNILNNFPPFPFSQDAKQEGEKNNNIEKPEESMDDEDLEGSCKEEEPNKAPLDLTCSEKSDTEGPSLNDTPVMKNRRKGKAFKLERALRLPSSDDEPDQIISKPDIYPEESKSPDLKSCETDSEPAKSDKVSEDTAYACTYCDMTFKDVIMYTMHMGYHGFHDPFTCNMCGQQTADKVSFFLHIARTSHS